MQTIHTDKAPAAIGPYSQAKKVGDWVFLSGQGPISPATGLIEGDITEQAEMTMKNVGAVLEAAGAGFENVVSVTCYLADMELFAAFNEVYARYFPHKPARTCIAARELPKKMLCEVQIIAYCGE